MLQLHAIDGTTASSDLVAELAQQHTAEAISRLVEIMRGPDPGAAVEAACELLVRAYGKPPQALLFDADGISVEVNASDEVDEPQTDKVNGVEYVT
jgi:hypothetical protein